MTSEDPTSILSGSPDSPGRDRAPEIDSQNAGSQQDHTVTQGSFSPVNPDDGFAQTDPPGVSAEHECAPPAAVEVERGRHWTCPECGLMWMRIGAGTVDYPASLYPWRVPMSGPELVARRFHETYERLAPSFGYETREASAKPWADVPEQNKRLMIAVAEEVGSWLLRSRLEAKPNELRRMAAEVRALNIDKGWRGEERSFGDMIALLHSEVSEALEAYRDNKLADMTGPTVKGYVPKPQGVGSELADVLIRLLDMAEDEYQRKMAFNWTRPYRHGGRTL